MNVPRVPRDAAPAPAPPAGLTRDYTPDEVVAISLWIGRRRHRAVAMAHYDTPDERRAYHLMLWPALPGGRRAGWY
ncbi:hypothetical protein [Streptomyces sp. NPDC059991]|uniref:hypothetical protein n=1 Tax=unclassified Streptomyces TaxID=2593676 RepID=UPI00369EE57B